MYFIAWLSKGLAPIIPEGDQLASNRKSNHLQDLILDHYLKNSNQNLGIYPWVRGGGYSSLKPHQAEKNEHGSRSLGLLLLCATGIGSMPLVSYCNSYSYSTKLICVRSKTISSYRSRACVKRVLQVHSSSAILVHTTSSFPASVMISSGLHNAASSLICEWSTTLLG